MFVKAELNNGTMIVLNTDYFENVFQCQHGRAVVVLREVESKTQRVFELKDKFSEFTKTLMDYKL